MCLSYVDLFKIIRNDHIFVRFSEEEGHYVITLYIQNFRSSSRPPESIRQHSFHSFIWALAVPPVLPPGGEGVMERSRAQTLTPSRISLILFSKPQ